MYVSSENVSVHIWRHMNEILCLFVTDCRQSFLYNSEWLMVVGGGCYSAVSELHRCHTVSNSCCLVSGYQRSVAHSGRSRKGLWGVDPERDQASGETGASGREVPPEGRHPWILDRWYVNVLSHTHTHTPPQKSYLNFKISSSSNCTSVFLMKRAGDADILNVTENAHTLKAQMS